MKAIKRQIMPATLILVVLLAADGIPAHAATPETAPETGLLTIATDDAKVVFHVELADTPESRRHGLQGRQALAADAGMLLLFERPNRARMWMFNTPIPLDMLFIDAEGRITQIAAQTTPFSVTPIAAQTPVIGVLEVPGGSAARLGIQPGDRVIHPAFMGPDDTAAPDG